MLNFETLSGFEGFQCHIAFRVAHQFAQASDKYQANNKKGFSRKSSVACNSSIQKPVQRRTGPVGRHCQVVDPTDDLPARGMGQNGR